MSWYMAWVLEQGLGLGLMPVPGQVEGQGRTRQQGPGRRQQQGPGRRRQQGPGEDDSKDQGEDDIKDQGRKKLGKQAEDEGRQQSQGFPGLSGAAWISREAGFKFKALSRRDF